MWLGLAHPNRLRSRAANGTLEGVPAGNVDALLERPKVLVLDDSDIVIEVVCMTLGERFDVRPARSLRDFGTLLEAWSPNVVLTDVNMPGITGGDLCRWIKSRVDTAAVAVVLFSDMPAKDLAALSGEVGADAYFSKADGIQHLPDKLLELCAEIVW
jgi:CheY-like chemotaxis protein